MRQHPHHTFVIWNLKIFTSSTNRQKKRFSPPLSVSDLVGCSNTNKIIPYSTCFQLLKPLSLAFIRKLQMRRGKKKELNKIVFVDTKYFLFPCTSNSNTDVVLPSPCVSGHLKISFSFHSNLASSSSLTYPLLVWTSFDLSRLNYNKFAGSENLFEV